MVSDGYGTKEPGFDTFAGKLNELSDNVRATGDLIGHMVADPGLFGVLGGQLIGAAASKYCADTRDAFNTYGEALEKHKEKLNMAKEAYKAQEDHVSDTLSGFQP